jgi:hypothetical protein
MGWEHAEASRSRRAVLGAIGGSLVTTAGCLDAGRAEEAPEEEDLGAQGYDVNEEPIASFDHFWDFGADDPFEDRIGGAHLEVGSEEVQVGEDAITVDGDGYVRHVDGGLSVETGESFSMGVWLNHQETGDYQAALMFHDAENAEAFGIGLNGGADGVNRPFPKVLSVNRTPGSGSTGYEYGDWHLHVVRYRSESGEAELWLDAELDYSVVVEGHGRWMPDVGDEIVAGFRPASRSDYPYAGSIAYPWVTTGVISEEEIRTLYEVPD